MCSIWRLTSLQKKLPLMKCNSHSSHSNEEMSFSNWVKPRQIMTIVQCPRFYPFPTCCPTNLVSGDSIASWEYLVHIMRMPSRCLSSVQSLEKDGLLWRSPTQQQLIRDNKELGREAGRVALKPALTFSLLKDDTFCKAASSWRFQSIQWHSYINLTWMGTAEILLWFKQLRCHPSHHIVPAIVCREQVAITLIIFDIPKSPTSTYLLLPSLEFVQD